jgi:simple sugar transport system permease protein
VLALLILLLNCTRLGVQIKTAGYHPEAGESVGVSVKRTRVIALIICGAMAGLGGAYLSMANLGYFSAGMVSGRGFIGIAAEAMGAGMPVKTTLFALLFGAVDYFAVGGQTVLSFPYELLNTLPYLMTLLALTIYAAAHNKKSGK